MQKLLRFGVVFIFLLIWTALPICAQDAPEMRQDGRAYYDFGVFAYEDGDYKGAENNLKIALEFEPDNPFYNHYLGKTCLKTERYSEAKTYLEKAWAADPEIPGLRYDMAFLKYRTGDYAGASDLFMVVAKADPENVLAHYYAGITLYRQQRYADGAGYFVHAAENSPTIRANGYYYAGLCYQKTNEIRQAIRAFEYVRDDPGNGNLKEGAIRWIAALKEREKLLRPYHLYAKLGCRYDDNVVLEPDDADVFAEESDSATLFYFSGNYDFLKQQKYKAGAGYDHYQTWYDDLDEYDLTGNILHLYAAYFLYPLTFRLTYTPTYYQANSDSYLRQHRLEPEVRWRISQDLLARLVFRYDDNTYFEDSGRSGHSNGLYAEAYYSAFNGRGLLFGGLGFEDRTATRKDEYFDQWRMRLGVLLKLPWELETEITGQYQAKNYDDPDSFYLVKREDDRYTASVSLSRKIYCDWLGIIGEYKYIKNESNINDYEYTRNLFTISVTASY